MNVTFHAKANEQVELTLEHSQLPTQQDYEDMQGGWSWALDSLKVYLETGQPIKQEEWLKSRGQV